MTDFRYTPDVLAWIRCHANRLNEPDMAAQLGCAPSTVRNICYTFDIRLCSESDRHADIAPLPGAPPAVVAVLSHAPKVHPRLNPDLRTNFLSDETKLRVGREAAARFHRRAAELHTSASVLMAVVLELVASDDLFDAVLNLDD